MKKKLNTALLTFFFLMGLNSSRAFCEDMFIFRTKFGLVTRGCKGLGMCTIVRWPIPIKSETEEMQPIDDNSCLGTLKINSLGEIEFEIPKESGITTEAYKNFFGSGFFIFEEDFTIGKELMEDLGYPNEFTIKAGKYPIHETDQIIKLTIAG